MTVQIFVLSVECFAGRSLWKGGWRKREDETGEGGVTDLSCSSSLLSTICADFTLY